MPDKYKTLELNKAILLNRVNAAVGKVSYKMGAKPKLGSMPGKGKGQFSTSDCSGLVRWLVYSASGGLVKMPEGSYTQNDWCKAQGFKPCPYKNAALKDGRVRIGFMKPEDGEAGHVVLIHNALTMESHGGEGVDRRPWNAKINGGKSRLDIEMDNCYVLTDILN